MFLIFLLQLKISGVAVEKYIKLAKMAAFSEDFHCGDNFDAVLAIFCYYGYGTSASEAVEKMATDEKDYRKCSFCFIVCIAAPY